ncbi:MAG: flagellar hook-associated protein FlgL [Hahellaceae bacterium]|nr:flagellar hook-associated protein FlgL [Hahellaceae bacterium]
MRISTSQVFTKGIDTIVDVNSQLQKTQQQVSSGKKILNPSDDPVASTRILELRQELNLNTQYQRNIELAENNLKLEDDLLGSISEVVQRVRELTINAGDGSLNPQDLKFIAKEIEERLEQLAGMMNSKDSSGEYVFGGFQGTNQPFVKNVSGSYEYKGDEGRRYVQIEASVNIAATENGKAIFMDIPSADKTFTTRVNPNNQADPPATITTGQIYDQEAYDAFYPNDMVIEFNPDASVVPPQPNYSVRDAASGRVLLNNQLYSTGDPIVVEGVQFEIVGAPVPGDTFFVDSTEKQGILTTTEKLLYGLTHFNATPEGRAAFDDILSNTLKNLDSAETSLLNARSSIGARLNTVDTTREQHLDVEVLTKEILSELEELDYSEAITQLSFQQFTLQAAYSTFSQVSSLSLFDRL